MVKRGRKSKTELTTKAEAAEAGVETIQVIERPAPPAELTKEQQLVWREIVESLPADWFTPENFGLLIQYCRHLVESRHVAQVIQIFKADAAKEAKKKNGEPFDVEAYDRLLKMQEREGRALSSLATRMRMTQQTKYDKTRKRGSKTKPPWEAEG